MANAVLGVDLAPDLLVLTKGRDFKWSFENLDASNLPVAYPAGSLYFELHTKGQHNAKQIITTHGATGGSYTLTVEPAGSPVTTAAILYNDESPDVQSKIAALAGVGAGNVAVSGLYYPQWIVTVTFSGAAAPTLPRNVQGLVEAAVKTSLNGIAQLGAGYFELTGVYTPPVWTFTVTYTQGLTENGLLTYLVDTILTGMDAAIEAVSGVGTGNVAVAEFYAPKRVYSVEFLGSLAEKPIPLMTATSSLTGTTPGVQVDLVAPGKAEYTKWPLTISGSTASLKVESEEVDKIVHRTPWQLVFLPTGEVAGGDPIARGRVRVNE